MNPKLLTILFLLGLPTLAAAADKETICQLVEAEALPALGFDGPRKPQFHEMVFPKEQTEAPSDILSQTCLLNGETPEGGAVFVVLETFGPDITTEAITAWFKQAGDKARAAEPEARIEETTIGEAVCESGRYEIPAQGGQAVQQRYVACDQLVSSKRHLTINLQRPDSAAAFPSAPQVKALLDKAASRLAAAQP
ncbi:MAG: hypothetical protein RBS40_10290 [Rhodocyclaceae bacterium]|jgi:hypothetical protein|nr:hypothetical protein [Rhodocyclaceae bacterium]